MRICGKYKLVNHQICSVVFLIWRISYFQESSDALRSVALFRRVRIKTT